MNQITDKILMIRPFKFGFNVETAANNTFQSDDGSLNLEEIQSKALTEFNTFVDKLISIGVDVLAIDDSPEPLKPDAIFPNNWISMHENGTVVTYPMFSKIRQSERRSDIIDELKKYFQVDNQVKFEQYESQDKFLEGTGSMILDHQNRKVYACQSPRTNLELLEEFGKQLNYQPVSFIAQDQNGVDIYHTNVMMALGDHFAVICLESIIKEEERTKVVQQLTNSKKEIIEISLEQVNAFAGNMLQVANNKGASYLVMSEQAYLSLNQQQKDQITKHTNILHSPLYTIEKYGGGSARCMMAEIFLPTKKN